MKKIAIKKWGNRRNIGKKTECKIIEKLTEIRLTFPGKGTTMNALVRGTYSVHYDRWEL